MDKIPFSSFQELNRQSAKRQVVLWGAGNICVKTMRKLNRDADFVVDNSANMWGSDQDGVEILSPQQLSERTANPYIVICTTSFREVSAQLISLGFAPATDFLVSPILNDLRIIDDMENVQARLLFSSGTQPSVDENAGGGLYELDVNGTQWQHRKVFSGSCHSILRLNNLIYTVDDELGLLEMDESYNVLRSVTLPIDSRGHGLAYHESTGAFYIACSTRDAVIGINKDFELFREIPLSVKHGREGGPFHHTNDCCIVGDSLYVSMFSETGNWKRDVFDGAVVEFDLISGDKIGAPITELWMPHNVQFLDGSLTVLDSLRGGLLRNNSQLMGQFPAFTRGLAYNGELFFIGQSRNRNFSKNLGVSKNISIDTGIVLFDEVTKVSRFLQLPPSISEIHGILYLDSNL